ncbi:hypothetical protein [Listeria sp. PSOL-1]|uniref:hypothetical protein n=1 Tax=Listeria sp. PSOL-1 TaxID=1844999 RepID=UPI0013D8942D|nr:hypothetical protein [Listeria sp. PSOL-1]
MKKIVLGVLISFAALIILYFSYYYGNIVYQKHQAKKPIEKAIQSLHIPAKEIYMIKDNQYEDKDYKGQDMVETVITTKKDYHTWKKIVSEKGTYLNPHSGKVKDKKVLDNIENCEITYWFVYDADTKKVTLSYAIDGTAVKPDQLEYFSYAKK